MARIERKHILENLKASIARGIPVIGTGAGTGISAKFEEAGGSDMIIVYNSGKFRMTGRPSACGILPLGDANTIMMELGREVLTIVKNIPVLAGVFAVDPYRDMRKFLKEIIEMGFSGVQNFPTIGAFDGVIGREINDVGFTYEKEVEMISYARELDLLTSPYAFNIEQAESMTRAGADIIVAHCGGTMGGTVGVSDDISMPLNAAVSFVQGVRDAVIKINPEILVICHGGPIVMPHDVAYILEHTTGIVGFYGASSAERLPVEQAVTAAIQDFKRLSLS